MWNHIIYTYQADSYCEACGEDIIERLDREGKTPDNPEDLYTYDSDEYPKPYVGTVETDSPDHCGSGEDCLQAIEIASGDLIGDLLTTHLTSHGIRWVADTLRAGPESEYQKALHAYWYETFSPHYPSLENAMLLYRAEKALSYLGTKVRNGEETFIGTKKDSPQWVSDLCFAVHNNGNIFPDDYRYRFLWEFLHYLVDIGETETDLEETAIEWARDSVSVYTNDLTTWLGSSPRRLSYMDEALQLCRHEAFSVLTTAQILEREEIAFAARAFLQDIREDF